MPVITLDSGDSPFYSVAFPPSGTQLAAGGGAPDASGWTLSGADDARRLCRDIGDPITGQEWSSYVPGAATTPCP